MFYTKTISVLFLGLLVHGVIAQDCTIELKGEVRSTSGELLIGASVQLTPGQKGTVSDENGIYTLEHVCAGSYEMLVRYLGFKERVISVVVSENTRINVTLEPDAVQLGEVVVVEKTENTDHAKNYDILSERDLLKASGKTLGESLKDITGVSTIQAGPGIFKPVIHGVHSQRVLILNHGIRQEGQQWGAEHAPEIDPFIASNIVVVKDASSIKYGTDALGGVVIVNPAPLPESAGIGGSINTVMQTNGRMGALSGYIEGGIKDRNGWGWRLQGTVKRAGDYHTPTYSLTNTGSIETDFSASVGVHKENYGIEIFFSHFQSTLGILKGTAISNLNDLQIAMDSEQPQYTEDFSYSIDAPRQEVSHDLLKVNGHVETQKGELRLQYGYQYDARSEFDIRFGDYKNVPALDLRLGTHTIEGEWENQMNNTWVFCNGVTGMFQNNVNQYGTARIPFIPNFVSASWGVYSVSKFKLANWVIDAGLRYDYRYYSVAGYDYSNSLFTNKFNFHNASFTAGATHNINESNSVSFSLSSAWRPPHVAELYSIGTHQGAAAIEYGLLLQDTTNEVMDINSVNFRNEQAVKFVTTYRMERESMSLEATGYANYIFNYFYLRPTGITVNPRGAFPYFRYTQTDALFLGADLGASYKLSNHFSANGKASLIRASDMTNNDYLVFIPTNRYEGGLRYKTTSSNARREFNIEATVSYTAKQNRAPRVITPGQFLEAANNGEDPLSGETTAFDFMAAPDGYTLLGFSAGLSVEREKARYDFVLRGSNILNTSYREYTNRFRYYANEIGRNISLTFKCTF